MSEKASDTIVVHATPEQIMGVILDLEAYPEWSPEIKHVEVLSRDDEGRPVEAHFDADVRVAQIDYTLRYDHDTPDAVSWTLSQGEVLKQMDGAYVLKAQGDATLVDYTLVADIAIPVPGFLKKRATKTILDTGLNGLKKRVESLH